MRRPLLVLLLLLALSALACDPLLDGDGLGEPENGESDDEDEEDNDEEDEEDDDDDDDDDGRLPAPIDEASLVILFDRYASEPGVRGA